MSPLSLIKIMNFTHTPLANIIANIRRSWSLSDPEDVMLLAKGLHV